MTARDSSGRTTASSREPTAEGHRGLATRKRVLFLLAISLVAGELGVRAIDAMTRRPSRNPLALARRPPDPFHGYGQPFYDGGEILDRNGGRHGFQKPAGVRRVVCLGGSTTMGYPIPLREILGAEFDVINTAAGGYTTAHMLTIEALNALAWEPDVLVASENVNDLRVAYFPAFQPDYVHALRNMGESSTYQRVFTTTNALFQHSELYWWIKGLPRRLYLGWKFAGVKGTRGVELHPIRRRSFGLAPPSDAAHAFERNLRSVVRLARGRSAVVLGTQPFTPSESAFVRLDGGWHWSEYVEYPLQEELVAHHEAYNEIIRRVAASEGVPLVDAAQAIRDPALFVDSVHLGDEGNRQLARLYAERIMELSTRPGSSDEPFVDHRS